MSAGPAFVKTFNRDGSRNIYCRRCRRLVGRTSTMVNFGSVSSCVVCDAADRGEILPDDVLEQLTAQSTPEGFLVPQFVFNEAKRQEEARKLDPMSPNVEDRLSTKFWFKAAGLKVAKGFKEIVTTALGSQKLAREKKRKRIFDRPIEDLVAKEMEEDK